MLKTKSRDHRRSRTPRHEGLEMTGGATLSGQKQGGRTAAPCIAEIGHFLDRRRAIRRARKLALRRQDALTSHPRRLHPDKVVRDQMLSAMPGWRYDLRAKSFVPRDEASQLHSDMLEELLDAVTDLRTEMIVLRVSGLSTAEAARVRGYLQTGSALVVVNHRTCEPAFIYTSLL